MCCAPFDEWRSGASNGRVPKFVVTPDDREWFGRCRRAWDLGARGRRGLVSRHAPIDAASSLVVALHAALAVHYFPGMWAWDRDIVAPLVRAAYQQAGGPPAGRALLDGYLEWAPSVDHAIPVRVDADIDVHVPDPVLPDTHLATAEGARCATATASTWCSSTTTIAPGSATTASSPSSPMTTSCTSTNARRSPAGHGRRSSSRPPWPASRTPNCASIRLGTDVASVARTDVEKAAAARRLAWAALEMIDPDVRVEPDPAWTHCSRCTFRTPCITMNRGDDPSFASYELRVPEILEEGRLGGVSWGMGRGAAPPFHTS